MNKDNKIYKTYEVNENCILQSESINNPILICSECCESKFIILASGKRLRAFKIYSDPIKPKPPKIKIDLKSLIFLNPL